MAKYTNTERGKHSHKHTADLNIYTHTHKHTHSQIHKQKLTAVLQASVNQIANSNHERALTHRDEEITNKIK